MSPNPKRRRPRFVIDTSVLVAGISGFRDQYVTGTNPSADLLFRWAQKNNFIWLVSEDILEEYKAVLKRLRVHPNHIGSVVNLIRERAQFFKLRSAPGISPDPKDDPFCFCANQGKAHFLVTLDLKHFPQHLLKASVVSPARFQT